MSLSQVFLGFFQLITIGVLTVFAILVIMRFGIPRRSILVSRRIMR